MLPKEAIFEYIDIYKKNHGKDLTFEEASIQAHKLIRFFQIITKPYPKSWIKQGGKEGDKTCQ